MAKRTESKETKGTTTDINAVQLIGTVMRAKQSEKVCRFTLDVTSITEKGNTSHAYIPCVWFNEGSEETVTDGERIGVSGSIKTGKYEKDGRTIYTVDVVAEKITFTA